MGDGSVHPHGLLICTDSYELSDVILLLNCLIIKFDLKVSLHWGKNKSGEKVYPRIYISSSSMPKLKKIVGPYIIKSMLYKIHS